MPCKVTISDYYETLLVNGIGHKRSTHQRHERSVKSAVSGFSRCALTCNFTHCEPHNGLARAQNSNLSPLTSETMWYQPILIEHLTVLILLQQHTHFSSSRRVSMWTLVVENVVHRHIRNTRLFQKFIRNFRKVHSSNCPRNSHFSPKIVCLPGTEISGTGPKIKKKIFLFPFSKG
jgi:hypothetical protein